MTLETEIKTFLDQTSENHDILKSYISQVDRE